MSNHSIFAVAVSEGQALQIERKLTEAGFLNDSISALIPDRDTLFPVADTSRAVGNGIKKTGGSTGGVLGGAIDLLAGIGELAIPGVGRLIAAGPLLATLNVIAAGAAVVGIGGALVGLGLPETAAKHYESRISGGDILISVNADTAKQMEKARKVLESTNAEDIAIALVPTGSSALSS